MLVKKGPRVFAVCPGITGVWTSACLSNRGSRIKRILAQEGETTEYNFMKNLFSDILLDALLLMLASEL